MQAQDSNDPTGVASDRKPGAGVDNAPRARQRKTHAAIQMKLAGATWAEIAMTLGYPTPRQALVAVEKQLEKELQSNGDRDAMRRLAGARLERLLRSAWPTAVDEKAPDRFVALSKCRELVADHRKLFGLDAPTEMIVHSPTQTQIEEWVAQITLLRDPPVEEYDIIDGEVVDDREIEAS